MTRIRQRRIILASGSPRRKEIMSLTGLRFEISPSLFNEDEMPLDMPPREYVREMAKRKAEGVAAQYRDAIVIGADTIVVCKNRILGKPKTHKEAVEILELSRNVVSDVLTGVSIIDTEKKRIRTFVDSTKVKMRNYSDEAIEGYIKTGKPLQYAGAFAIQDRDWVKSIRGSFFNVVGFPILRVLNALADFGVKIDKKRLKSIKDQDKYVYCP